MDANHENKLTMFLAVKEYLEDNAAATNAVPAFAVHSANFLTGIADIEAMVSKINTVTSGKTKVKHEALDALVEAVLPIAAALVSYGNEKKDTELVTKATVAEYSFRRLRDTLVIPKAREIVALGTEHAADLAESGITAEDLSDATAAIDAYAKALGKQGEGFSERSTAFDSLYALFDSTEEILTNHLDNLVTVIGRKDKGFLNGYLTARAVKHLRGGNGGTEPPAPPQNPTP